jgi:outer membrane protein insertion porin family
MSRRQTAAGLRLLVLLAATGLVTAGCARPRVAELYPQVGQYAGRQVDQLEFRNIEPFSRDSLRAITESEATRCQLIPIVLPICVPGTDWGLRRRFVELEAVGRDVSRLTALYRQSGYFGTLVIPEVEEIAPGEEPVRLIYRVERGPAILVDTVIVEGTEGIADPDSLAAELRLQPGDMFELPQLLAASDDVAELLRAEGHAYAEVLRNYTVDVERQRATAWLVAVPGPRVTVDTVVVQGLDVLDERTIRRQLTIQEGDLLRLTRARESQRNLYELEMTQFASVAVAPDTLQVDPEDPTTATLLVQITEAPEHLVEAVAGFGTQDCIRTGAQWVDRSFLEGARRLTVSGSVSRIAAGLCEPRDTLFDRDMDYRFTAELVQPFLVSHRNRLAVSVAAERTTQPGLFRRTSQGARVSLTHRLGARELLFSALEAEHRETQAVPALYCYAFAVCTEADIEALSRPRWRNALSASWTRDRGNRPVSPTHGYSTRLSAVWSSPLLASDYDFVRSSGEISVYRTIRPRWVFGSHLRLGSFLTRATVGLDDFIPPEERFYAGGANSVRGYPRNQLGPGVWVLEGDTVPTLIHGGLPVQFFPTGGTSVAVASAEVRFPAPWIGDRVRMAAFVDAGMIALKPIWKMDEPWRVTPGAGVRVETPVGPVRIDLAYNPNPRSRGPLVVADARGLVQIDKGFRPDPPGFWRRFQLHIAVGQAF